MTMNRETLRETVGNLTLQDTKKVFSPFQFLCMAKYSISPYSSWVRGLEAILCTLILSGGGFRHLSTFSCVSILPQDVRNVRDIWTHPIHSEDQKCTLPFLQPQRHCDFSGPFMYNFMVKEEHQISCSSSNLPFPISGVQSICGRFS